MRGRYNAYTPERAARVCALLGQGKAMTAIGTMEGMPSFTTLVRWRGEHPEIEAAYQAAKAAKGKIRGPRGAYGTMAQVAARRAARAPRRPAPGRPTSYSEQVAEEVCARIAAGESMLDLSHDAGLPPHQSLYVWMQQHEDFARGYRAACEVRAELMCDEVVAIADDEEADLFDRGGGEPPWVNIQAIRRARLKMQARMWRVGKLAPRKYGPRPAEDTGPRPITLEEALLQLELEGEFDGVAEEE